MPGQLESAMQRSVNRWAGQHRIRYYKVDVRYYSFWPDVHYIGFGGDLWLEFKRPGEVLTPGQARMHKELVLRNQRVYTVSSREQSIFLLKSILDAPRVSEDRNQVFT